MDTKAEIDYVKTITLAIEANLYHKYNRNINKTSEYTSKSRFIVLNLKHERNFDLRFKILLEIITPSQLADMTEDELAPKSVYSERLAKQQEFFDSKMMTAEATRYIIKSRKGDIGICDMNAQEPEHTIPASLEVNQQNNLGKNDSNLAKEANLEDSKESNYSENEFNDEIYDVKTSQKDIEDEINALSWGKFKVRCTDRYTKYLPSEISDELQSALC